MSSTPSPALSGTLSLEWERGLSWALVLQLPPLPFQGEGWGEG